MKTDRLLAVCTFLLIFTVGVTVYQNRVLNKYKSLFEQVDTTIKRDTIFKTLVFNDTIPQFIEKTKKVLVTDTLWRSNGDSVKVDLKKKEYTNTLIQEEDTVEYHAYISGYDINDEGKPTLDSINFKHNNRIINTTVIIEKPIPTKKKLFYISPQAGIGYGIINKQFDTYVGVGIGINL